MDKKIELKDLGSICRRQHNKNIEGSILDFKVVSKYIFKLRMKTKFH